MSFNVSSHNSKVLFSAEPRIEDILTGVFGVYDSLLKYVSKFKRFTELEEFHQLLGIDVENAEVVEKFDVLLSAQELEYESTSSNEFLPCKRILRDSFIKQIEMISEASLMLCMWLQFLYQEYYQDLLSFAQNQDQIKYTTIEALSRRSKLGRIH